MFITIKGIPAADPSLGEIEVMYNSNHIISVGHAAGQTAIVLVRDGLNEWQDKDKKIFLLLNELSDLHDMHPYTPEITGDF